MTFKYIISETSPRLFFAVQEYTPSFLVDTLLIEKTDNDEIVLFLNIHAYSGSGYPATEQFKENGCPAIAVWFRHTLSLLGQQSSFGAP